VCVVLIIIITLLFVMMISLIGDLFASKESSDSVFYKVSTNIIIM